MQARPWAQGLTPRQGLWTVAGSTDALSYLELLSWRTKRSSLHGAPPQPQRRVQKTGRQEEEGRGMQGARGGARRREEGGREPEEEHSTEEGEGSREPEEEHGEARGPRWVHLEPQAPVLSFLLSPSLDPDEESGRTVAPA